MGQLPSAAADPTAPFPVEKALSIIPRREHCGGGNAMAIMVDYQIREAVHKGMLGIENFATEGVQPASYDLRIGAHLYSATTSEPDRPIRLDKDGGAYRIPPYGQVILLTHETLRLPKSIVGRFGLTSSLTRKGLFASAGPQVDPGYEGKLFVSLWNQTPVSHVVSYLDKFLSIEFQHLEYEPERAYEGPHQGRRDISAEILRDLLRNEGFNLNQMQTQFTELSRHVKEWSALATRFDEFLQQMTRHSEALEKLAKYSGPMALTSREEPAVIARKVDLKTAMKEILKLFREKKTLYYSDIADALNLDFATVIDACDRLQKEGLIEGASNE
jgi:dCTP deaminase